MNVLATSELAMGELATTDIWPALFLSLRVTLISTLLVTLIAIPLAYVMARKRFRGRSLVEALLVVPLVLPPTVVGYFILVFCGSHSFLGRFLARAFDYSLILHWGGAVVASTIVALPLLYLPARASFANVERELEDIARLFGAGPIRVFWHVSLPLARRGIGSGLLLAAARALGEFGATQMVMGDIEGQQTLPMLIYNKWQVGEMPQAIPAVCLLTGIALLVILLYNRSTLGKSE